jgi:hypothetical protein
VLVERSACLAEMVGDERLQHRFELAARAPFTCSTRPLIAFAEQAASTFSMSWLR